MLSKIKLVRIWWTNLDREENSVMLKFYKIIFQGSKDSFQLL